MLINAKPVKIFEKNFKVYASWEIILLLQQCCYALQTFVGMKTITMLALP